MFLVVCFTSGLWQAYQTIMGFTNVDLILANLHTQKILSDEPSMGETITSHANEGNDFRNLYLWLAQLASLRGVDFAYSGNAPLSTSHLPDKISNPS